MTGSEMFTPTSDELLKVVQMNSKSPENELMFELAQKMVLIKGIVFHPSTRPHLCDNNSRHSATM